MRELRPREGGLWERRLGLGPPKCDSREPLCIISHKSRLLQEALALRPGQVMRRQYIERGLKMGVQ